MEAKQRLDTLISKSRVDMYKPIAIAEILQRHRVEETISLTELNQYKRRSYDWIMDIIQQLHGKTTSLNSKYWDQMFDEGKLSPDMLEELGEINLATGIVETYIYGHLRDKFLAIGELRKHLKTIDPKTFLLSDFLSRFEKDTRFARSIDKAYEIVVYALFNAIIQELEATVTLSVDPKKIKVIKDFEDFTRLVLGIDSRTLSITQPANLFRVGTANANDAGLDMWANFGPAIQVKHITLDPEVAEDICQSVRADQVVIVCKHAESSTIKAVLIQLGLDEKVRGIITEVELNHWYSLCFSDTYLKTLGLKILTSIEFEMQLEFPLSNIEKIDKFLADRGYDIQNLTGDWEIIHKKKKKPSSRPRKPKEKKGK